MACRSYKSPMGQCLCAGRWGEFVVSSQSARRARKNGEKSGSWADLPFQRNPLCLVGMFGQGLEPHVVVSEGGKGSVVEDELDEVAFDVVEAEGEVTDPGDLELGGGAWVAISFSSHVRRQRGDEGCARSSLGLSGLL